MATVADVGESAAEEHDATDASVSPPTPAVDTATLAQAVAQVLASQQRARRSPLLISLIAALIAGLLGIAAAGYVALRADLSALYQQKLELHQAIMDLETRLRADMTGIATGLRTELSEFRTETNATLLKHTAQLAQLETALGLKPT
jgi:hypothetical protein